MINKVRRTTFRVAKLSKEVRINKEKIAEIAKKMVGQDLSVPDWPKGMHLETENPEAMLDYLIILDSLNFCFWSEKERWQIEYDGKNYNGYFALALALKKFFEENPEKGNLKHFAKISFEEFKEILQGGENLLFLDKRWEIARQVSSVLLKKYVNSKRFVLSAGQRLSVLVSKIYKDLPSFDDISEHQGKRIYFLKRAQILGCDIWGAFEGKGVGRFKDIDCLTAFADYKIPQILNHFGILEYSLQLKNRINEKAIIPHDSKEEIEIRANTIWAVEYLKEALSRLGKNFYSFEIDWILWNKAQETKIEAPYHLTETIFY